jgi:hypothetical protein
VSGLFFILAGFCFGISATRKVDKVPWVDIGLVLLTVGLFFAVVAPGGVDLD